MSRDDHDGRSWLYKFYSAIIRGMFRVIFRLSIKGMENIPRQGGVVIAPNHSSFLDPPLIGSIVRRKLGFMAKKELFIMPVASHFLKVSGSIPVDRTGFSADAVRGMIRRLEAGEALGIFPEGTRTRTGQPGKPRRGVGIVAVTAGVPIVPCLIKGTFKAIPFLSKITVRFLPPFSPDEIQAENKKDHYLLVSERIMHDIAKLRMTSNTNVEEQTLSIHPKEE